MNLQEKLALAERVAREAGRNLVANRDFRVERKARHDYVTEMDRRTERFIRGALLSACPEDAFFGEEYGAAGEGAAGTWIVDPIDGTTNFIRDLPSYAVSIAYQLEGELVLGCVYWPVLDEMYLAEKGRGATRNGQPIHVSGVADAEDAIVAISFCHRCDEENRRMMRLLCALSDLSDMRRYGSAALDLCMVACGRQDAYIELGLCLYDIAAGVVILREAGGRADGWPGEGGCELTGNVLASNGPIGGYLAQKMCETA